MHRISILAILLLSSIALQIINPLVLSRFIDAAVAGKSVASLMQLATLFMVIAIMLQIVAVAETAIAESIGWAATNALRTDLARHCLQLDMTFHKRHTPGEMIERIDGDVNQLANFFSRFTIYVTGNLLLLVGILIVLFRINWIVGVVLTAFAIIVLLTLRRLQTVTVPRFQQVRQVRAELFGFLEEWIAGTEDIRANGATTYVLRLFAPLAHALLKRTRRANVASGGSWATTVLLFALGTAIALTLGITLLQRGLITIGVVYLILNYTEQLRRPLEQVLRHLQNLQQASASINRIQELLLIQTTLVDGAGVPIPAGPLSVTFAGVSFGYARETPVIKDVSFALQPGKTLGILGRTGSGKTTLTRLLFRLYDVDCGSIRLSGVDIRDATLADVRQHIGLVTQDVEIFQASVRDNLTFFDATIPSERILQVITALGLNVWYQNLPAGLETELTSGGDGLSAGEAQLLALARIFLKDPSLILFDEASARLDVTTERLMEQAITRLLEGRTAIVIAHRLETIARVDEILILEDGEILEYGSRTDLAQDPHSRFYHLLQLGQQEAAL